MFPDTSAGAVLAQLEPFHERLRVIFCKAVARFNSIEPMLLLPLVRWNRSRSTCIWAFAMEELELAFPPESGVKLVPKYETLELHFGPNLVARLKKMTAGGFTSNYPTKRAQAFHGADQGELFELMWSKPLRVDIGYLLNDTGTEVDRVMVARRKAPKIMDWVYPIEGPDSAAAIPLEKRPLVSDDAARVEPRPAADSSQQESTGTDQ